jgi:hypothetical protein
VHFLELVEGADKFAAPSLLDVFDDLSVGN